MIFVTGDAENLLYSHFSILVAIEPISGTGPCVRQTINVAIFSTQASPNAMLTVVAMLAVIIFCAAQKVAPPTVWAIVAVGADVAII